MNINSQRNGLISNNYTNVEEIAQPNLSTKVEKDRAGSVVTKSKMDSKRVSEEKNLKEKKELLENQVAESEDGDTLQLSKSAVLKFDNEIRELSDKKVRVLEERETALVKENEQKVNEQKTQRLKDEFKEAELKREVRAEDTKVREAKEAKRAEILKESIQKEPKTFQTTDTSFVGKSDSDIAKMFLKGDISKAEYDEEIESRESRREAISAKEEKLSKKVLNEHAESEEMVRFEKELKLAFSKEDKGKIAADDRLKAIEAAQGEVQNQKEKEIKIVVNE